MAASVPPLDDWADLYKPPTEADSVVQLGQPLEVSGGAVAPSAPRPADEPPPEVAFEVPAPRQPDEAALAAEAFLSGIAPPEDEDGEPGSTPAPRTPARPATAPLSAAAPAEQVPTGRTSTPLPPARTVSPLPAAPHPGSAPSAAPHAGRPLPTSGAAIRPPLNTLLPHRRRPPLPTSAEARRTETPAATPPGRPGAAASGAGARAVGAPASRQDDQPIPRAAGPDARRATPVPDSTLSPAEAPPPRRTITSASNTQRRSNTAAPPRRVRPAVPPPDGEGVVKLLLDNTLAVAVPREQLLQMPMSPTEAYILWQLDGTRTIAQIYQMVPHLDPHEVRTLLEGLLERELVLPG